MIAVKAIYEDGQIRLLEPAPPVHEAAAVVVFLDTASEAINAPADELEDEIAAYHRLHAALLKDYLGRYVAIYGGTLVDHDADFSTLHQRIRRRFGKKPVLVRRVETSPERELIFRSPRLTSDGL